MRSGGMVASFPGQHSAARNKHDPWGDFLTAGAPRFLRHKIDQGLKTWSQGHCSLTLFFDFVSLDIRWHCQDLRGEVWLNLVWI